MLSTKTTTTTTTTTGLMNTVSEKPVVLLEEEEVDVVIVGAGIAGLTAALVLLQGRPGLSVRIYEVEPNPGGRVKSINLNCISELSSHASGLSSSFVPHHFDAGAAWVHGIDGNPLVNFIHQTTDGTGKDGLTSPPLPEFLNTTDGLYASTFQWCLFTAARQKPTQVSSQIPDYKVQRAYKLFTDSQAEMEDELAQGKQNLKRTVGERLVDYLKKRLDKETINCSESIVRLIEFVFEYYNEYCASSLFDYDVTHWMADEDFEGPQLIAKCLARSLLSRFFRCLQHLTSGLRSGHGEPYLLTPPGALELGVDRILYTSHRVSAIRLRHLTENCAAQPMPVEIQGITLRQVFKCRARCVIVTVPLGVLKHRHDKSEDDAPFLSISPPLCPCVNSAIDSLGFGVFEKLILSFDKPFWAEQLSAGIYIGVVKDSGHKTEDSGIYQLLLNKNSDPSSSASLPSASWLRNIRMVDMYRAYARPVLVVTFYGSQATEMLHAAQCERSGRITRASSLKCVKQLLEAVIEPAFHVKISTQEVQETIKEEKWEEQDHFGRQDDTVEEGVDKVKCKLTDWHVTNWSQQPSFLGAFSYMKLHANPQMLDCLAGKHSADCCGQGSGEARIVVPHDDQRLFFAGEATCKERMATVSGAYISGTRVANQVLDSVWAQGGLGAT